MEDRFKDRDLSSLHRMDIHDYMELIGIDTSYEGVAENFEQLEKSLERYSLTDLWDYPLEELEHCNELGYKVVIVYYYDATGTHERLYQID